MRLLLVTLIYSLVVGCGDITFKVGRKEKIRPEFVPTQAMAKREALTLANFDSFLQSFESDLRDDGSKLVNQLKSGLREKLRSYLSQIESSVITNATQTIIIESPLMSRLNDLPESRIQTGDLDYFVESAPLQDALGGFLAIAVKNKFDEMPDPQEIPQIDLLTSILFYDLGINVDGYGAVSENETAKQVKSTLEWQVIPEDENLHLRTSRLSYNFYRDANERSLRLLLEVESNSFMYASLGFEIVSVSKGIRVATQYGLTDRDGNWLSFSLNRRIELDILDNQRMSWKETNLTEEGLTTQVAMIDLETLIAQLQ